MVQLKEMRDVFSSVETCQMAVKGRKNLAVLLRMRMMAASAVIGWSSHVTLKQGRV